LAGRGQVCRAREAAEENAAQLEEGRMTPFAKAIAIGTITALLIPVVVVGVMIVAFTGVAVTGGGIAGVSVDIAAVLLLLLVAGGFAAGFAWTLRRARRLGQG
jgi:hypothetical protein